MLVNNQFSFSYMTSKTILKLRPLMIIRMQIWDRLVRHAPLISTEELSLNIKKGWAYYYSLLSHKNNKTLLWEKSRKSLERDWEKLNLNTTIEINQYKKIIKSVLSMKHHNYLKQFMVKLFRNNLYFKNITSKFSDSGTICNSCKEHFENRHHFFLCNKYLPIIEKLNCCFINLEMLKTTPSITPYFFNTVQNHISRFVLTSIEMYPDNNSGSRS